MTEAARHGNTPKERLAYWLAVGLGVGVMLDDVAAGLLAAAVLGLLAIGVPGQPM